MGGMGRSPAPHPTEPRKAAASCCEPAARGSYRTAGLATSPKQEVCFRNQNLGHSGPLVETPAKPYGNQVSDDFLTRR